MLDMPKENESHSNPVDIAKYTGRHPNTMHIEIDILPPRNSRCCLSHANINTSYVPVDCPACQVVEMKTASPLSLLMFGILRADDVDVAFPSNTLQRQRLLVEF